MTHIVKEFMQQGIWLSRMTDQAAWGLTDLIQGMGLDVKGIEIGVNRGLNSAMLLDACPNITKLIGIDPYKAYVDWLGPIDQSLLDRDYSIFLENYEIMKNRFELIKLPSEQAASQLDDNAYDFVFIDGDHSTRAVVSDLEKYVPKVKVGGLISGHDVGIKTVNIGLQAWFRNYKIDLNQIHVVENHAWYWKKDRTLK